MRASFGAQQVDVRAILEAVGLGGMVTPPLLRNTLEDLARPGELSGVDRTVAARGSPGPPQPPPDPRIPELQAAMQP